MSEFKDLVPDMEKIICNTPYYLCYTINRRAVEIDPKDYEKHKQRSEYDDPRKDDDFPSQSKMWVVLWDLRINFKKLMRYISKPVWIRSDGEWKCEGSALRMSEGIPKAYGGMSFSRRHIDGTEISLQSTLGGDAVYDALNADFQIVCELVNHRLCHVPRHA